MRGAWKDRDQAVAALRVVVAGVAWAVVAVLLADVLLSPAKQADLRIYTRAARAFAAGVNPYVEPVGQFVYPPLTLFLFWPLTWLSPAFAHGAWLAAKLLALAGFFRTCHLRFLKLSPWAPATLVLLFAGYNQAIFQDLRSGNVALFEQTLLLAALACLLDRRLGLFVALLLTAAQFKLTPLLFVALPLLVAPREWRWVVAGMAGALGLVAAHAVTYPMYFLVFLRAAAAIDERGLLNPSSFAFLRDAIAWLSGHTLSDVHRASVIAHAAWMAAVLLISGRAVLRARQAASTPDERLLVLFACVVYGLVLPRFKDYSYVLLLVPALDIARRQWERGMLPYPLIFVLFSVLGYGPLFGNFLVWLGYLGELRRSQGSGLESRPSVRSDPAAEQHGRLHPPVVARADGRSEPPAGVGVVSAASDVL